MAHYDVRTIGWTTDAIVGPFNGFSLHYLLTLQNPTYQNFSGTLPFKSGSKDYNFNDKIVSGISQVLMEIDPSYTWKDLRLWASARYFSKQTVNRSNTLYIAPRWETFAGLNYQVNSSLGINATVVNLLNQSGISGSVDATDLYTEEEAKDYINRAGGLLMTGTYIRPFTVEFGLKYNF
jgi:outer membrane receptor for ferrienterochelin and colicin